MVAVIGEALIDLVQQPSADPAAEKHFIGHPGGSPFNVAVGLSRLGQPTRLLARLSRDTFGRQLRAHAESNGVDLSAAVDAPQPSTLAVVGLDANGVASYDFYLEATADWQWTRSELEQIGPGTDWVHTGSLASWTEPGATVIADYLRATAGLSRAGGSVISFDPNVRASLMPSRAEAVRRIEALIELADVVKASEEDVSWLYPDTDVPTVLARWSAAGASLVVITLGAAGAIFQQTGQRPVAVAGRSVAVVDTVGAGDAFMAGLINALIRTGTAPAEISTELARSAVAEAILVSALTCQRAGANPPTAAELAAALAH